MSHPPSSSTSPYAEGFAVHSDHSQGPPRKKMRKGTKSCLECRRRKIKCTFESGRPAICNECYARGSTCIDQEHGDIHSYMQNTSEQSSYSLRERVSQLEDLVKQVLHRLPEKGGSVVGDQDERSQVDTQAAEVLKSLKSNLPPGASAVEESLLLPRGLRQDAPALTLFNNNVITRKEEQPSMTRAQYNKTKALITALKQLLPPPQDLEIILESSHEWWTLWRTMFPEITDRQCETIKESVSHSLRSEKPAEIAKIMLCIAISIHQLPPTFDWSRVQLKEDRSTLMERYISTVDRLITSDDEIAATLDGIECMMLEAKYQINMGRPRRAWLLFHRAIAFAQLLGFHRLASQPDKSSIDYQRQLSVWCHLIIGDRCLPLLLGLPYSVADAFVAPYFPSVGTPGVGVDDAEAYIARMIPVMTKIVDRNQSVVPLGYSATLRMDQELEELHNAQDPSWWTTERIPGSTVEEHFNRLQAQFLHHHTKVLLHMPFMLRFTTDKRYQYSHNAALDGAREMIRYYDAFRTNKSVGPFICKLIDFEAFTATMLLLLNLCGYSQQHRAGNAQPPDVEQDQKDLELIDLTIALLHDAAKEAGGVVAAQCAQALEMLTRVRQGCGERPETNMETCKVSIPYFGTISIGLGKHFVPMKTGTYPRPGASQLSSLGAAGGPNSGLPTPPSITSTSTQPSPMCSGGDNPRVPRAPVYESTDYIAPGLEQGWPATDDPFVSFDSFMALPAQATDLSSVDSSADYTPQQYSSATNDSSIAGGFPFSGLPFNPNASNVDLDQGWNWFGVDRPVMQ